MLLQPLEFALNKYLNMDPESMARLACLENKVIELEITDWRLRFFIVVQKSGLELLPNYSGPVATHIRSKLIDLIKIARAKGDTSSLFQNKLEISGDIAVGEALQKILANIDIDWEEQLSKITGDVAAHHVGETARNFLQFAKNSVDSLAQQVKTFLQIEQNQLPARAEFEDFVVNVRKLQQDVERLEARMAQKGIVL